MIEIIGVDKHHVDRVINIREQFQRIPAANVDLSDSARACIGDGAAPRFFLEGDDLTVGRQRLGHAQAGITLQSADFDNATNPKPRIRTRKTLPSAGATDMYSRSCPISCFRTVAGSGSSREKFSATSFNPGLVGRTFGSVADTRFHRYDF